MLSRVEATGVPCAKGRFVDWAAWGRKDVCRQERGGSSAELLFPGALVCLFVALAVVALLLVVVYSAAVFVGGGLLLALVQLLASKRCQPCAEYHLKKTPCLFVTRFVSLTCNTGTADDAQRGRDPVPRAVGSLPGAAGGVFRGRNLEQRNRRSSRRRGREAFCGRGAR